MSLRVGVVGARRVRQGLGPYVVRHLRELGAVVPCFLGSRPDTLAATEAETGARGYTDLRRMLDEQALDALAIHAPAETHEGHLEAALEAKLHAFCDKPLVWGGGRLAARAAALEEAFAAAGLGLHECCQWPETLPAYRALHPDVGPVRAFAMRLSPAACEPRAMLGDTLSHPLSLLQALVPGAGAVHSVRFARLERGAVELHFSIDGPSGPVTANVVLETQEQPPRRAGYAVNGRWAERRIRPGDYAFSFAADEREVAVPDPLRARLARFVAAPERSDGGVGLRMAALEGVLGALPG